MLRRRTVLTAALPVSLKAHGAAKARTLLIGDVAPYAYAAGGDPQGIAFDLVQAISKQYAMPLIPRFVPMSRAFLEARAGEPSLVVPVSRVDSREAQFTWLVPLIPVRLMFFARAGTTFDISTLSSVSSLRVGALRAPGLEELYRSAGVRQLEFVTNNEVAVRMLMANRLDAILTADGSAIHLFRAMGLAASEIRQGAVVAVTHLWLVASRSLPGAEAEAWRDAGSNFLASSMGKQLLERHAVALRGL